MTPENWRRMWTPLPPSKPRSPARKRAASTRTCLRSAARAPSASELRPQSHGRDSDRRRAAAEQCPRRRVSAECGRLDPGALVGNWTARWMHLRGSPSAARFDPGFPPASVRAGGKSRAGVEKTRGRHTCARRDDRAGALVQRGARSLRPRARARPRPAWRRAPRARHAARQAGSAQADRS